MITFFIHHTILQVRDEVKESTKKGYVIRRENYYFQTMLLAYLFSLLTLKKRVPPKLSDK